MQLQTPRRRTDLSSTLESIGELPEALRPVQSIALQKKKPKAKGYVPGFEIAEQERSNWCWSAVAQGIKKLLDGVELKQCLIIERTRPEMVLCCEDHDSCNQPFFTERALRRLKNLREPPLKRPLSLDEIIKEIPEGAKKSAKPIGCGFTDGKQGGHAVVIFGWEELPDRVRLRVGEPKEGAETVEYLGPLTNSMERAWVETYLTKKRSES